jgi:hypothetical protein
MPTPTNRAIGAALAALAIAATAACEADSDTMSAEACDAYAAAQGSFFGDPAQMGPAFAAFADAAPGALADEAQVLADAAAASLDDPGAFEAPEVSEASAAIGDAVFDDCDTVAAVDVEGVDYAFGGLPEQIDAGRVAFRLENATDTGQPHELVVVTGTEGQSAEELSDLPMDELMMQARPVAVAFVDEPGGSATTLVDLTPGSYLVICSLPVMEDGAEPSSDEAPHDTHADHGMVATLTVV